MTRSDLDDVLRRLQSQRPLHWSTALHLVRELEALHSERDALRAETLKLRDALHVAQRAPASSDGSTLQPGFGPRRDDVVGAGLPLTPAPESDMGTDLSQDVTPRELALELASIDLKRLLDAREPLISARVPRRAGAIAAGLQKGKVTEVESALMYLEGRGLVVAELPEGIVTPVRPQRYRWSQASPLEMVERFVRTETARGGR